MRLRSLGWLLLTSVVSAESSAQTFSAQGDVTRDIIPALAVRNSVWALLQPTERVYVTVGVRDIHATQQPFQGLPRIAESMQTAFGETATVIGARTTLRAGASIMRSSGGTIEGGYLARVQYALPLAASTKAGAVTATFGADASSTRDVSVTTALHERVRIQALAGDLNVAVGTFGTVAGRMSRDRYSDGNRRRAAYGYALARVPGVPAVSLGYAYSYSDSDFDTWRSTGSTLDAATGRYRYSYFYYPYFTPIEERGHSALATAQWAVGKRVTLGAKATVPFSSTGRLQATVSEGSSTTAPPSLGYYTRSNIIPTQYEATLGAQLTSRVRLNARFEHFNRPFYSSNTAGVGLQVTR